MKSVSLFLALSAALSFGAHAADLTVSAAASLTDAFNDIGKAYTEQYPQDKVFFNFAGSGALLKQLQNGAPADVFAGLWEKIGERNIPTQNVRQSLDYVARGEVEAGFVYATDAAMIKDKVKTLFQVPLDEALSYPIAVSANSQAPEAAQRFVQFVLSEQGQNILRNYGFLAP